MIEPNLIEPNLIEPNLLKMIGSPKTAKETMFGHPKIVARAPAWRKAILRMIRLMHSLLAQAPAAAGSVMRSGSSWQAPEAHARQTRLSIQLPQPSRTSVMVRAIDSEIAALGNPQNESTATLVSISRHRQCTRQIVPTCPSSKIRDRERTLLTLPASLIVGYSRELAWCKWPIFVGT